MIAAVLIAEDEAKGVHVFDNEHDLKIADQWVGRGASLYGAGGCGLYTEDDAKDIEKDMPDKAKVIRDALARHIEKG